MALFLNKNERAELEQARVAEPLCSIYWALINRVEKRASTPGLGDDTTTVEWWHCAAEYLTDAAMVHALKPSEALRSWLRSCTLEIVRRPIADWIGPEFRDRETKPPIGNLETAHLTWAVAVVYDLAAELFDESEQSEIRTALKEKGIELCQRWLDVNHHMANWRCVLNAGVAVAAAVLDEPEAIERAADEIVRCADVFQPDGSYSESLQYGNYAGYTLMLAREALVRYNPKLADQLPLDPWVRKPRWDAASLFYQKPLTGWGAYPRPRSANFNDSAAIHRASADFILHIAARAKETHRDEAGLARWLFDTLYTPYVSQAPFDRATFGFVNDFGFLTLPLFAQAADPITPQKAGLTELETFSCGDVLARDAWEGRTILAAHIPGDPLYGPGHLHGDLNSFILVHNQERLLVDPGHSCYRNLIHDLEASSLTHNTCTFQFDAQTTGLQLQEELLSGRTLQQSRSARRRIDVETRVPGPPFDRGGQRLLTARQGDLTVIAADAAALYGIPITRFARFWFLCGSHALFIVDHIMATIPVKTSWNWLLNNRDGALDLKPVKPDRMVARRGHAGMKLFHLAGGDMQRTLHAYVHDAYHPLPNQLGEGQPGSGMLMRWTDHSAATERIAIHAIALDSPGAISGWHLKKDASAPILESPGATESWKLDVSAEATHFTVTELTSKQQYVISQNEDRWTIDS